MEILIDTGTLEYLERLYPERSFNHEVTEAELREYTAQRALVRNLRAKHDAQQERRDRAFPQTRGHSKTYV